MAKVKAATDAATDNPDETTTSEPMPEPVEADPVVSSCVVNGGRGLHVGQAVNGVVCSYHAMHYDSQGNRR